MPTGGDGTAYMGEATMTPAQKRKDTMLKKKYEKSDDMMKSFKDQYGEKEGEKIFYAKIRKDAMKEDITDEALLIQDWNVDEIKYTEVETVDIIKPKPLRPSPSNWREELDEDFISKLKMKLLNKKEGGTPKPGFPPMKTIEKRVKVDEDWQKVNRKDKTDGLSKKAVKAYRRENPGSKLQTAVTTKPSKLKKGSKSAKRRLSFCRRMKGMKKKLTSAKTRRDPDSRINKALRRWNC